MSRESVRQKWQSIVAVHERGNLSIAQYCRKHKINPASFYQWRKKLDVDNRPRFLPVVIEQPSAPSTPVRVCFANGAMIEVQADSNPIALQLAVSVLS